MSGTRLFLFLLSFVCFQNSEAQSVSSLIPDSTLQQSSSLKQENKSIEALQLNLLGINTTDSLFRFFHDSISMEKVMDAIIRDSVNFKSTHAGYQFEINDLNSHFYSNTIQGQIEPELDYKYNYWIDSLDSSKFIRCAEISIKYNYLPSQKKEYKKDNKKLRKTLNTIKNKKWRKEKYYASGSVVQNKKTLEVWDNQESNEYYETNAIFPHFEFSTVKYDSHIDGYTYSIIITVRRQND